MIQYAIGYGVGLAMGWFVWGRRLAIVRRLLPDLKAEIAAEHTFIKGVLSRESDFMDSVKEHVAVCPLFKEVVQ